MAFLKTLMPSKAKIRTVTPPLFFFRRGPKQVLWWNMGSCKWLEVEWVRAKLTGGNYGPCWANMVSV